MLKYKNTRLLFYIFLALLMACDIFFKVPLYSYFILAGVYFVIIFYGSFYVGSGFHIKAICSGDKSKKEIAITFDDGPDEKTTEEILKVLKEHDAKAAFFCIGKNVTGNPELLKKMDAEDHIIGNHAYNHSNWFDFYPAEKMKEELQKTHDLIEKTTEKKIKLYRPPYGVTTPAVKTSAEAMGYDVIGWSLRSLDTLIKDETKLLNRVIRKLQPGDIILFHEGDPKIISVLREFLKYAREKGYRIVPLDELLRIKAYS